jgi:hypothetical protein
VSVVVDVEFEVQIEGDDDNTDQARLVSPVGLDSPWLDCSPRDVPLWLGGVTRRRIRANPSASNRALSGQHGAFLLLVVMLLSILGIIVPNFLFCCSAAVAG